MLHYIVFSNLQKHNQNKINDIKRIHSFKADPNISVIWNVGDWCSMITLTLQHYVGVFFGVGTVRYNPFLLRYSLIGPHTPSATKMEANKTKDLLFKRVNLFLGNTYVYTSTLRDFVKVSFFIQASSVVFFYVWEGFSVRIAFLEVWFGRHRSSSAPSSVGFHSEAFVGMETTPPMRRLKASLSGNCCQSTSTSFGRLGCGRRKS